MAGAMGVMRKSSFSRHLCRNVTAPQAKGTSDLATDKGYVKLFLFIFLSFTAHNWSGWVSSTKKNARI